MRPTFVLCFALLAVAPQRQCAITSLMSPEVIQDQFQQKINPYFPNAKVSVAPNLHAIVVYACTHGTGEAFVGSIRDFIAADRGINQALGYLQFAPLIGGAHYQFLILEFDSGSVVYNLDAKNLAAVPMAANGAQEYTQACGIKNESQPTEAQHFVWVGRFQVQATEPDGTGHTDTEVDPLGLYKADDQFEANRDDELAFAAQRIRARLAKRNWTV